MAKIRVNYHYEGGKPAVGLAPQAVQRTQTEGVVVDVTPTISKDRAGNVVHTSFSEPDIRTALSAVGVGATGFGGLSLKIEGYSSAA